ncbi:E3 ubiquitin-protein ligase SDIR1 [Cucurbita argyrosperma subsp. argyrosperma]|uniref:E3 ubiquitin-protein ligase EL5 n=1 Tax=Cucurbita moschata TaxID=3662 RepID=A0A6J1ES11_CUCMO|nr:E3 ubiquitin-protein ligase EL5 [Cucurbita moschata]KAG7022947.1 E3 ubiquitin-protein ligase SDIR1 [Cucurbita argyrosperma subsp. argyrosperma]
MSRRPTNFPPGLWRARREYDHQRYNTNDSNRMSSTSPHPQPFQNSSRDTNPIPSRPTGGIDPVPSRPTRELDPIPWRPTGGAMIARLLEIVGQLEDPPAIVRIITHSRPRQIEASSRPAELYRPTPRSEGNSTLTSEEQNMALNKLKKKVYDPPNNASRRISFYYRENNRRNYNERSNGENDEDGKRCAVCLEDFQPKEEVMTTPCNHMFHEECIVPWVKSHGQCPNCRFTLFERTVRREASSNNAASIASGSNLVDDELVYLIRAMEDSLMLRNLTGLWGE